MLRFIDPALCVTHAIDVKKVEKYKLAIIAGNRFPPIEVVEIGNQFIVIDGAHRTMAFKECNEMILAFVYDLDDCPKKHLAGGRMFAIKDSN